MHKSFNKKKQSLQNLEGIRRTRTNVFKKEKTTIESDGQPFTQCTNCKETNVTTLLQQATYVCPKCGQHLTMPSAERLIALFDKGRFRRLAPKEVLTNPLIFPGYSEKQKRLQDATGLEEAALAGIGKVNGKDLVAVCMDSRFLMGSMGVYVGELVTIAIEYAMHKKLPLLIFTASGGARMQEGIFSLMQMAKTSAAIEQFSKNGGFYIAYLTHPTTGGVSASFASLGDITLAEPNALIGFAGPRVIKETIKQALPDGFQTAEYLMKHGFVDQIVARQDMRATIGQLLTLHTKERLDVKNTRK